jgi:hypothetical protein
MPRCSSGRTISTRPGRRSIRCCNPGAGGRGLEFYDAGATGPAGADALLARDGRAHPLDGSWAGSARTRQGRGPLHPNRSIVLPARGGSLFRMVVRLAEQGVGGFLLRVAQPLYSVRKAMFSAWRSCARWVIRSA